MKSEMDNIQTVTLGGRRFVILPEEDFLRLRDEPNDPPLPEADSQGYFPAVESMRAILARDVLRARRTLGWSQEELARRAKVPLKVLQQLEQGTTTPGVKTVDKIDEALKKGEKKALGKKG